MTLPNNGEITGMGIRKGVTLIVGGGYHGKSTLLNALEYGIYNHIPDDGREFVVTNADAVKIRAEDGRSIQSLNIDPFISNLPFDQDTTEFSTANASGSTSQAANILEALEVGASTLLLDEDTLATNFMIRDIRMKTLIAKEKEPITPFVEHVRSLYEEKGISTVIVMGGSGDYFSLADVVIGMIEYSPHDLTSQAHQIVKENPLPEYFDATPPSEIQFNYKFRTASFRSTAADLTAVIFDYSLNRSQADSHSTTVSAPVIAVEQFKYFIEIIVVYTAP